MQSVLSPVRRSDLALRRLFALRQISTTQQATPTFYRTDDCSFNPNSSFDDIVLKAVDKTLDLRRDVPWFPSTLRELIESRSSFDVVDVSEAFINEEYHKRRTYVVDKARTHKHGEAIPVVDYTEEEHDTWRTVYRNLREQHQKYACDEYNAAMANFNRLGVITPERVPQLRDVSEALQAETGFQIRPVAGYLSARTFLNSLGFRLFWSTQYIRHHSNPSYSPEPDICHELLGHVPLFADRNFADFSQMIGLQSLGATDEQIDELAALYFFTVEFGVLHSPSGYRAYGAGILSSCGELEWACSASPSDYCRRSGGLLECYEFKDLKRPVIEPLVAKRASKTPMPVSTYQPKLFASASIADAKKEVSSFCQTLSKPFVCQYDPATQQINVTSSFP